MQSIYVENIKSVLINKSRIERELKVKIENKGRTIFIKGNSEQEYTATEVIRAIDLNFPISQALLLKDENFSLHILNIKDITRRKNLSEVRARIIGREKKAINNLRHLTRCKISLKRNEIGIIGDWDDIKDAIQALTSLIQGSTHGKVYSRLERIKRKKKIDRRMFRDEIVPVN